MDRDVINALHHLYQYGEMEYGALLHTLWCPADTAPSIDGLAESPVRGRYRLNDTLTRFIKEVEAQLSTLPKPEYAFGFPLSDPPRPRNDVRLAFVAMPYRPDWFPPVAGAIARSAAQCGFRADVARDFSEPGSITDQVWRAVRRSELVVADISDGNPNVFYEIGLAHALGKPVTLLSHVAQPMPFDVATTRLIPYQLDALGALEADLGKAFRAVPARYKYDQSG